MTTKQREKTKQKRRRPVFIPDPPKHRYGEMTSFQQLGDTGNVYHLVHHFGSPETTIIKSERYLMAAPRVPHSERRIPDLVIAFDADPERYKANNAYIISEQGKPPDFVLEVASRGTWRRDRYAKREDYLAMGIPEYWRFDETGRYYGERLAGDRLVNGAYQPFPIEALAEGGLQGYSPALNLYLRWENEELRWYDPSTGEHIATFESERDARLRERLQAQREQQALESQVRQERQTRLQAQWERETLEAQLEDERRARRQLEDQLRQRGQGE